MKLVQRGISYALIMLQWVPSDKNRCLDNGAVTELRCSCGMILCCNTTLRLQSAPCSNIYNVQCACGSQVGWAAPPYWGLGPGNWCLCIESLRRCASVFLYYCARTCVHRSAVDAQARPVVRYHQEVFVHGLTETSSVQLRRDHSGHLPWMTWHNTTQQTHKHTTTLGDRKQQTSEQ